MATRKVEIGVTGETVRENIKRIRESQGWRLDDLSELLTTIARRPMSKATLSQIETGGRRVDVDDLVALAYVLNVNPNALLLPPQPESEVEWAVELTGTPWVYGQDAWDWAEGRSQIAFFNGAPTEWSVATFERNIHARTDGRRHAIKNRHLASESNPEVAALFDALRRLPSRKVEL